MFELEGIRENLGGRVWGTGENKGLYQGATAH